LGLEEDRTITSDEGLKGAKRYNLDGFIEVSPKTGKKIEELFNAISRLALQTRSVKKKIETKEISPLHEQKQKNIEKEDKKRLSVEKKEENKRIVLKEEDVKKRLNNLVLKLEDLDINLEELDFTWNSFIESIDSINLCKKRRNRFRGLTTFKSRLKSFEKSCLTLL